MRKPMRYTILATLAVVGLLVALFASSPADSESATSTSTSTTSTTIAPTTSTTLDPEDVQNFIDQVQFNRLVKTATWIDAEKANAQRLVEEQEAAEAAAAAERAEQEEADAAPAPAPNPGPQRDDPAPEAPAPAPPAQSGGGLIMGAGHCGGDLPPCYVMQRESKGYLNIWNGGCTYPCGSSSASGKWQFVRGTWGGYGGYSDAAYAPESVQDAKARELWAGGRGCGHWAAC